MSADITYLTLGGREKTACTTGDIAIPIAPGQVQMHGQLSWAFGTALEKCLPEARWSDIVATMTRLIDQQGLALELGFHGRPTARFHG